jgi:aconitate hydratase
LPTGRRSGTCRLSSAQRARSSPSTPRRSATSSSRVAPGLIELVEAYANEQGLWHDEDSDEPTFTEKLELDLSTVVPSIAGPKRPQDRVSLTESKAAFRIALEGFAPEDDGEDDAIAGSFPASDPVSTHVRDGEGHEPRGGTGGAQVAERTRERAAVPLADGTETELDHGHVVIAAITSCTNTSNPSVMLGAGILARNAVQRGHNVKPWMKTSLAPGSKVVMSTWTAPGGPSTSRRSASISSATAAALA